MLSEDVHKAHVGTRMVNNEYRITVPEPGVYHLRYWVETKTESITSKGNITDTELDVDTPINFTIKPFEVIVMEGINTNQEAH